MIGLEKESNETSEGALPGESWRWLDEYLSDLKKHGISHLSALEGGGMIEKFEIAFSDLSGAQYAVAVSSGTAALHTALLACDVGPGDEVIVSPYGWGQTVGAATPDEPLFPAALDELVQEWLDQSASKTQPFKQTAEILCDRDQVEPISRQVLGCLGNQFGDLVDVLDMNERRGDA